MDTNVSLPQTTEFKRQWSLLTWLLVPLVLIGLSVNYIVNGFNTEVKLEDVPAPKRIVQAQETFGAKPIPAVAPFQWQNTGLVTFWFDDAWDSQYDVGYKMLKEYGFVGTIAVPTYLVGNRSYMNWDEVKEVQDNGWEITSHTRNHNCLIKMMSDEYIHSEIVEVKEDFKKLGLQHDHFVTPCGVENEKIHNLIRQNYKSLRGSGQGLNSIPIEDPYAIQVRTVGVFTTVEEVEEWLNEAKRDKKWLILMFHRVNEARDIYDIGPGRMREITEAVKNSGLPVVLPSQALSIGSTIVEGGN